MEDCVVLQESEGEPKAALPSDMFYQYEELRSRPVITPGSEIPEDFLHLSHSFGYDSRRRANLQLLDDRTLIYIAGNLLVLLDVSTKEQRFLRSCSGGGIGAVAVCCSGDYFAVAEKGLKPNIVVYEKPSLRPHRVLRGGAKRKFSFVDFNQDGSQLASLAGDPDYTLTIWNWTQEEVVLMCNAFSQEVYRATFSPYNPQVMTSSGAGHIKFWKVSSTFTGLKLKGTMGRFKQTPTTDIKGYVELPDDKVISGSEWGNLLLWAGKTIQVEICRKEGRSCHNGTVQPFSFVDGMLMTAGADGFIRVWNLDRICPTSINSDSCRFQLEPIHEMLVGHNVCLSSVVRSPLSDSFIWFAQDANGAIWKLDLSFLNTARDPECLFSFHTGPIQGLDVSNESHLMATTALDRSVRVFDFLSNRELISSQFTQGGTTLRWAPSSVHQSGGLLVAGFEDGVVRFLELYKPGTLRGAAERSPETAKLRLREAFKPHSAPVTAVAYKQNGLVLATGSSDGTVFFFMVGEKYNPIGFIQVPGPVQALEWSPHREDKLLVLCRSGHVVEVQSPGPETVASSRTFLLSGLPRRFFKFKSIKSQIKRDEEIRRRQAAKEKRRRRRKRKEEEEEEEELPPLHIPDPPSPICCGFYSQPGQFWLSMGGFDAGFLYHCRFSENQDQDLVQRQDEPFDFRILSDTEDDPVCSMTFSSNRQLLLCGMSSGSIRVYPLQPGDHGLTSMQACWSLSVHDNQYGRLRHVRFSHDELFVLTAGDDGNIFSFSLLPPEELQKLPKKAKVPSARVGVESETMALDIENPAAYSLEAAKQKLEKDHLQQESELKLSEEKRQLAELQRKYKQVLIDNQKLPEQFRLTPEELSLDPHFNERFENLKAQRLAEVRKELAGDLERSRIGLRKMQRLNELMGPDIITVVAIRSNHRVSTYGLQALPEPLAWIRAQKEPDPADGEAAPEPRMSRAEPAKDGDKTEGEVRPRPPMARPAQIKRGVRQGMMLRKQAEKAEKAEKTRARIERRKLEWAQIYAAKPPDDYEDPQLAQAIREAEQKIEDADRRRKPEVDSDKKKDELISLQHKIQEKQKEMNSQIVALRDVKVQLLSQLTARRRRLQEVQQRLAARHRLPLPTLFTILPEETPEKRLQPSPAMIKRYWEIRQQRLSTKQEDDAVSILKQLEEEMKAEAQKDEEAQILSASSLTKEEEEEVELTELEKELKRAEEIRLLHEQKCLLQEMDSSICQFDFDLRQLCRLKLRLDYQLKLMELHVLTIFRELLQLRQFQSRDVELQKKLKGCIREEKSITAKLEKCNELLELKTQEITKLEERKEALTAAFQASLGEKNLFKEFLTKVFKKKVKRVKKKEQEQAAGEDQGNDAAKENKNKEESDLDDSDKRGASVDETVCPEGCEPKLLEYILQLRERRLDLEELLAQEQMVAKAVTEDRESLIKKDKEVKKNRQDVDKDMESINQEKLEKLNQLEVLVPLHLNQIMLNPDGSLPSDLSQMVVVDSEELRRLQEHCHTMETKNIQRREELQRCLLKQKRLLREEKELMATVQKLQLECNEKMMNTFGRLVDLDALQVPPDNRSVEEFKQEKLLLEKAQGKELRMWEVRLSAHKP
ncbi:cilia- and flagella-associated protein 44 [Nematolebias whitei]|uniref:cilia- and flagella-associated protein 44 n=1 Tax=Nematolebias whitei TaxID=451745 RepID=UPI001897BC78|nr:cilia- and flagella-associated protein 44 [Nematolebias whitei]